MPAGFTPEGLPVGIQIVGRYRDDLGVLQLAHAFEQATRVGLRRPPLVLSGARQRCKPGDEVQMILSRNAGAPS